MKPGVFAALAFFIGVAHGAFPIQSGTNAGQIQHVIIIYPENRSFDSLYGNVPGANGIAFARPTAEQQVSKTGNTAGQNYPPNNNGMRMGPSDSNTETADARFHNLDNTTRPYDISPYVPIDEYTGDMLHQFYIEQYQINDPDSRLARDPKNAAASQHPDSKFAAWSDNPGLTMGHFDVTSAPTYISKLNLIPSLTGSGDTYFTFCNNGQYSTVLSGTHGTSEWLNWDSQYTIADNAFHSAFGGSFLNHIWFISARSPVWTAYPGHGSSVTTFGPDGFPTASSSDLVTHNVTITDCVLTNDPALHGFPRSNTNQSIHPGDYWAVNTIRPLRGPSGTYSVSTTGLPLTSATATAADQTESGLLPLQTFDTIGDRLSAAGIHWAWYSEGWNDAKAGLADFLYQPHHQPFAYFANFALATAPVCSNHQHSPGVDSPGSAAHLKDFYNDFYLPITSGSLPVTSPGTQPFDVSFIKPIGENNAHPGYASVQDGADWMDTTLSAIKRSPLWDHCVIFVLYDEHGGQWDHVQPPHIDDWGPGTRIPFMIVGPGIKRGFVDHTQYETVSILNFLEQLFGLPALNTRDAAANPPISPFVGQPDLLVTAKAGRSFHYVIPNYVGASSISEIGSTVIRGVTIHGAVLNGTPKARGTYNLRFHFADAKSPANAGGFAYDHYWVQVNVL